MVIFDANMILRYLLRDNESMANQAKQYLIAGNVTVTIEVIAEVVYVLQGIYDMERQEVADKAMRLLQLVDCRDYDILPLAIRTYAEQNLDFVDCVLYAYHKVRGAEIATFDKKLLRLMELK